jgi:hypothetical protein
MLQVVCAISHPSMCARSHIGAAVSASDGGIVGSGVTTMRTAASQGYFQQQPRRSSAAVAGLSAALVASALTVVLMMSSPAPVAAPDQAATTTAQCQMTPRKLLVSTATGGGTVRLRAGGYLSPPIRLSATPQAVVFPAPRPTVGMVEEVITVEGNADNVMISSELTGLRKVLDVAGVAAFNLKWLPMKNC